MRGLTAAIAGATGSVPISADPANADPSADTPVGAG